MRLEPTIYQNYKLVIDEFDIPVAVQIDGEIKFKLQEQVKVSADSGYIGPGITKEGIGTILRIRRDETDYFFGVLMSNGEFGYVKDSRLTKF